MKEYKLSAKSKYSVLYLLCGLFMFFFMFAILNLSSFAEADSTFIVKYGTGGSSSSSCTVTMGSNISVNYSVTGNTLVHISNGFYVTTTEGTFLIRSVNFTKASGTFTDTMGFSTSPYTVSLPGSFVNAYISSIASDNDNGSVYIHSASDFVTYSNGGNYSSSFNYSDYSSISPVSITSSFRSSGAFGSVLYPSGTLFSFSYPDYSGSGLEFANFISFSGTSKTHFIYSVNFTVNSYITTSPNFQLWVRKSAAATNIYNLSPSHLMYNGSITSGQYSYTVFFEFDLPDDPDTNYCCFFHDLSSGYTYSRPSFTLSSVKYTIADYMQFVQDNWNAISPSVSDMNTNTAQTVSDINTVNTFEASTFDNFDSLADSSGLNSFSLSSETHVASAMNYLSTCIVTVYNGFPSDLKWLIQAIGIFGIFALLLSVFGRVGKRISNE